MSGNEGSEQKLSRRERQVMDIVYAKGRVSAADLQAALPDDPSYSATRMLLQRLQKKDLLSFETDGPRYIYKASTPKTTAVKSAWNRLVQTFFGGSAVNAFSALLGASSESMTDEEFEALEAEIARAKEQRR